MFSPEFWKKNILHQMNCVCSFKLYLGLIFCVDFLPQNKYSVLSEDYFSLYPSIYESSILHSCTPESGWIV